MRRNILYLIIVALLTTTFIFTPSTIASAFTKSATLTVEKNESESSILGVDSTKKLSVKIHNSSSSTGNISYEVLYYSDASCPAAVAVIPKHIKFGEVIPGKTESIVFQGDSGDYILHLRSVNPGCKAFGSISYSSLSPASYIHDLYHSLFSSRI